MGLFIACAFYVAAIACESIFAVLGFSSINTSDFEGEELNRCKKYLVLGTERVIAIIAIIFAATLPLGVFPYDGYMGLAGGSWFGYGLLFAAVAALICWMLCRIINTRIASKWDGFLSKEYEVKNEKRKPIRKKYLVIFAAASIAVFMGWYCVNAGLTYGGFVHGKTFDSIDDFKEYIETPMQIDGYAAISYGHRNTAAGQEISEAEALTQYIYNDVEETKVICEYIHRNEEVVSIDVSWPAEGEVLIETYTEEDYAVAIRMMNERNKLWLILYILLVALILLFYFHEQKIVLK